MANVPFLPLFPANTIFKVSLYVIRDLHEQTMDEVTALRYYLP